MFRLGTPTKPNCLCCNSASSWFSHPIENLMRKREFHQHLCTLWLWPNSIMNLWFGKLCQHLTSVLKIISLGQFHLAVLVVCSWTDWPLYHFVHLASLALWTELNLELPLNLVLWCHSNYYRSFLLFVSSKRTCTHPLSHSSWSRTCGTWVQRVFWNTSIPFTSEDLKIIGL